MADESRMFDQQVHDAFERVELSEDAQERILANLLTAQRSREFVETEGPHDVAGQDVATGQSEAASQEEAASEKVVPFSRRRFGWRALLPLAAVLAVAAVVVSATNLLGSKNSTTMMDIATESEESSYAAKEVDAMAEETSGSAAVDAGGAAEADVMNSESASEPTVQSETVALDMADEAPLAAEESATQDLTSVDYYPRVEMSDGTLLTALRDGLYTEEVPTEEVGKYVCTAVATSFDDTAQENGVSCMVYELTSEAGAYAVKYESEETYWRCVPYE